MLKLRQASTDTAAAHPPWILMRQVMSPFRDAI
jgi:hypothetical protein